MKLLYLSCHSILEYDELKIFEELGIDYFSLGSYINPKNPVDPIRPALTHTADDWAYNHAPDREAIPKEFFDKFDVIVVMHVPEWIEKNWENMKHKRVIWRTIGQSTTHIEQRLWKYRLEGLQVARYSLREANLPGNIGCDKLIRFYKDENEFKGWIGAGNEVVTFAQDMMHRGEFCNYDAWLKIANGFNAHVYGPKNENSGALNGGFMTYEQMQQKMRDCGVYIYTGTQPASYVLNFIESWMTGAPVIALGRVHAGSLATTLGTNADIYEVQDFIKNGVNGFISDDIEEIRGWIKFLLEDKRAAKRIGDTGRADAIKLFGKEVVKLDWKKFLNV